MLKYITKRLLYMVFVFFTMSVLIFALYNAIPGDPAMMQVSSQRDKLKPEQFEKVYQNMRKQMGLDDPAPVRYGKWIKSVVTLQFGDSIIYKKPVTDVISEPMKNTIFLNLLVTFFALGITIPLGIYCAVKKFSKFDTVVQVLTIIGYSLPVFIFALIIIYVFAVQLRWFPVSGMNTPNIKGSAMVLFLDRVKYMVLPTMVLTLASLGGMTRYVRAAMIDALRMDYIRTARAKGLRERVVIYSHAWRNALLPIITLIISWFIGIFSGSIITESIFALNGMGRIYLKALNGLDYNLAMGVQMFYIVVSLVGNLIIDLSYGIVDPRVRITK